MSSHASTADAVLDTREWYRVGVWAACEDEPLVRASSADEAADIVRDHNALVAEIRRLRDALARRVPPSDEQLAELAIRAERNSRSRTWRIVSRLIKTITTLRTAAERAEQIPQLCDWLAEFKDARSVDHTEFHYGSPCPYADVVPAFLAGRPDPRRLLVEQLTEGDTP